MKKYFYADKTYSIISFLKCIGLIAIYIIINENLKPIFFDNPFFSKCIYYFVSFLYIIVILFGAYYLRSSIDSRIKPLITICSHFIILEFIFHEIIPWDQIITISINNKDTLTIIYNNRMKKKQVKKPINHILNKDDLIVMIREFCINKNVEFTII
jgi:hypothetical protein